MNISALNSINYTNFGANKVPNKAPNKVANAAKHAAKQPVKQPVKQATKQLNKQGYTPKFAKNVKSAAKKQPTAPVIAAIGCAAVGAVVALSSLFASKNNDNVKPEIESTMPSTSIVETFAVEETQPVVKAPTINMVDSIPINMREDEEFHKVKAGEKLTDIVIEYAELDEDYPYEKMIPYFERLLFENEGKIKRVEREGGLPEYTLLKDVSLRVDGILPENIISNSTGVGVNEPEPTVPETEPTAPIQITSADDTVFVANREFCFDLGTMDKNIFGDCEGLICGDFAKLDKKSNGGAVLTMFDGINDKSNKVSQQTFDKDGKIIEVVEYEEDKVLSVTKFAYETDQVVETTIDKTAKSGVIDEVVTTRDNNKNIIKREFKDNGNIIATFDFAASFAKIGDEPFEMEDGSFICNDLALGENQYVGIYNGAPISFTFLKNGFEVEYSNIHGKTIAREVFDVNGQLIFDETL